MSTHIIPCSISKKKKKKITLNYPNMQLWNFSRGLNIEFETAMVNEPSVFEPLKFYCIISQYNSML